MGKATQDLRKEHDAILFVLKILDQMMLQAESSEPDQMFRYYGEVLYFLRTFADQCHHGKEENYLFKALVQKGIPDEGGPIGVMLQEHTQGRDYIAQKGRSVDSKDLSGFNRAAVLYRDLLRQHIEKENNVLFVMADRIMNQQEQDLLFEQFEQHEENVIGHGVHEKLHAMIDVWAKTFSVELSTEQREELLNTLKIRFKKNRNRHSDLQWEAVQERLERNPAKLWSLHEMERTGGEPDVVGQERTTGDYIFFDCSEESPKDRRNVCYDREALESRKANKPDNSAIDMAVDMGIELLTEEQYRELQKLGNFDRKTSSWVQTPERIRKLGGAIFCDRRYDTVFVYHNGAESYYSSRGFRGSLHV